VGVVSVVVPLGLTRVAMVEGWLTVKAIPSLQLP
jgi:hypothetical protein